MSLPGMQSRSSSGVMAFRSAPGALADQAGAPEDEELAEVVGHKRGTLVLGFSPSLNERTERRKVPLLNIVMLVAGTRGDVQPFIALGIRLQEYGHRVRLASHKVYRSFVTQYGLEFFPLGGDPVLLSDFIVRNRGVVPTSLKDAFENMAEVEKLLRSTYAACVEPDVEGNNKPFRAQAIIANPVSYGHIHCAEKLRIPLHMFFTMPWTPTIAFPHPLSNIKYDPVVSTVAGKKNKLSYSAVNQFLFTGMFVMINKFREEVLDLNPLGLGNQGSNLIHVHRVPFGYCWSEKLVPKPADWYDKPIDIVGYFLLPDTFSASYQPSPDLAAFLKAGPTPVYVGFGSLVVDDPVGLTKIIVEASRNAGVRILLSRGWGKLGEGVDLPPNIHVLGNVPHDWLFPQCSAVVHHGGAGTTAAGLLAACPTTIVPFFGDQHFWGGVVLARGVGPKCIPVDKLSVAKLTAAFQFMAQPEVVAAAKKLSEELRQEDGVEDAVEAFHQHLPVSDMIAGRPVIWNLAPAHAGQAVSDIAMAWATWYRVLKASRNLPTRTERVAGCIRGSRALCVEWPVHGCQAMVEHMDRSCCGCAKRPGHPEGYNPLTVSWCSCATVSSVLCFPFGLFWWLCVPGCMEPNGPVEEHGPWED